MKKYFLLSLLSLLAISSQSGVLPVKPAISPINVSCTQSVTTGVVPQQVKFNCAETTSSLTQYPFHELEYSWNFGDPNTTAISAACGNSVDSYEGYWRCSNHVVGTTPDATGLASKNVDKGPVATHVYETPGSYNACVTVKYNTSNTSSPSLQRCFPVTVTAWPINSNTVCVNPNGDSDFSLCPTIPSVYANQAACISASRCVNTPAGTSAIGNDHTFSIAYITSTVDRVLFKRGGTWQTPTSGTCPRFDFTASPSYIGAYGSGAKPIFSATTSTSCGIAVRGENSRIVDLSVVSVGSNTGGSGFFEDGNLAATHNHLWLRLSVIGMGTGFDGSAGTNVYNNLTVQELFYQKGTGGAAAEGDVVRASNFGWLGSYTNGNKVGFHVLRIHDVNTGVISHNRFLWSGSATEIVSIRTNGTTRRVLFSDNYSTTYAAAGNLTIKTATQSAPLREYDIIIDRNWFDITTGSASSCINISNGSFISIRNNICNLTFNSGGRTAIGISQENTSGVVGVRGLVPDYIWIYNNVAYDFGTSGGASSGSNNYLLNVGTFVYTPVSVGSDSGSLSSHIYVSNNIHYVPAPGAAFGIVSGTLTYVTQANNSSDITKNPGWNTTGWTQAANVTPQNISLSLTGLSPSGAGHGYALSGGTAVPIWSDFNGASSLWSDTYDMGPFHRSPYP